MNQIPSVNYFVFGVSSDQDKQLLNEILKDTDPEFSSWAVNQLLQWKRENRKAVSYEFMEIKISFYPLLALHLIISSVVVGIL